MSKEVHIDVEHVTRVEGHGNILLDMKDGKIEKLQWQVSEAPRFFEAMLRGRHYDELRPITSRICGICSIGHSLASLKATEDALGISISQQTQLLRRLAINGENMQSHVLHFGYLAAPDLLGVGSVFPLVGSEHSDALLKIIRLHRLANHLSDVICGRTTHPITLQVGGFSSVPTKEKLLGLKKELTESIPVVEKVAGVFESVCDGFPDFMRETEYIALSSDKEYALYDGMITSTDTGKFPKYKEYRTLMQEYVVPQSTAKYAKHARDSYMVGALARYNINHGQLHVRAQKTARLFKLKPPVYNPFMNTIAQVVEFMHNVEDSIVLIDELLKNKVEAESPVRFEVKAGHGVGVVEVPRGILVHEYTLNDKGKCVKANCVIPTNQNHANIQKDMEALVPQLLDKPKKDIELQLEMLVRAYDPCISCSTH